MFMAADWLAIYYQSQVTRALKAIYILAALMGLAFIAYSDLRGMDLMVYLFLVFFAAGVIIYKIAERRSTGIGNTWITAPWPRACVSSVTGSRRASPPGVRPSSRTTTSCRNRTSSWAGFAT
jgi:hypothetical protein